MEIDELTPVEQEVYEALKQVIDPELHIDIVNLGLIYDIQVDDDHCVVTATLTTVGCPLADVIFDDIKQSVLTTVDGIKETEVKLVWYPPWNPSMMSRYARIALGISQ